MTVEELIRKDESITEQQKRTLLMIYTAFQRRTAKR